VSRPRAGRDDPAADFDEQVGPEVTLGEMVFPPNSDSGDHKHGATEMFYVVSGELDHVVNGKSQILKPGMAGYVKPPDSVRHKTGPAGAKVVVVWVPGDEGKKMRLGGRKALGLRSGGHGNGDWGGLGRG
jgi:quercetin dioxygenase-like cupin family protein